MSDETNPEPTEAVEGATQDEATSEATPETVEFTTVREYRHAARNALREARSSLSLRNDATGEVYSLLNGLIENIIKGRQGLSQEAQVEHLFDASEQAKENREQIVALAEAARDAVIEQVNAWPEQFAAALDSAVETLSEAKVFAEERDFASHQSKKRRSRGYYSDRRSSRRYW